MTATSMQQFLRALHDGDSRYVEVVLRSGLHLVGLLNLDEDAPDMVWLYPPIERERPSYITPWAFAVEEVSAVRMTGTRGGDWQAMSNHERGIVKDSGSPSQD